MIDSDLNPFVTVVRRTDESGAVVVAKSNLDEFGMGSGGVDSCHGPSKSVWRSGIPYALHNTAGHSRSALNHPSFKADTGAFPRCEHLPNFFLFILFLLPVTVCSYLCNSGCHMLGSS